jgi:hypothetical protein
LFGNNALIPLAVLIDYNPGRTIMESFKNFIKELDSKKKQEKKKEEGGDDKAISDKKSPLQGQPAPVISNG